jgi:hypothetical protein
MFEVDSGVAVCVELGRVVNVAEGDKVGGMGVVAGETAVTLRVAVGTIGSGVQGVGGVGSCWQAANKKETNKRRQRRD